MGLQLQGKRPNRPEVDRDVFADQPVAPGGSPQEPAFFIDQLHRKAVEFGFGRVGDLLRFQFPFHAGVEGQDLGFFHDRVEAEHRLFVRDLR